MNKELILKKVESFLDRGYTLIIIRDDEVFSAGGRIKEIDELLDKSDYYIQI